MYHFCLLLCSSPYQSAQNSVIQTYWVFPTQMGISEALVHILLSHVTYITNTPCIIKALLIITFVMSDSVCLTVQMEYRKK